MKLLEGPKWIYSLCEKGIDNILTEDQTKYSSLVCLDASRLVVRFSMSDQYDSNGFFGAKFVKTAPIN